MPARSNHVQRGTSAQEAKAAPQQAAADKQKAELESRGLPQGRDTAGRSDARKERSSGPAMTAHELAQVNAISRELNGPGVFTTVKHFESAVAGARASLMTSMAVPAGSFLSRVGTWLTSGFGLFSSPMKRAQNHLSEKVEELRDYSKVTVKPITEEIQKRFQGRTFERNADTPRALVLASVPTELKHLNHDFENLKNEVGDLVTNSAGRLRAVKGLGDARIAVSRKDQYGNAETLELAFRREGKVTIFVNGKEIGGMWNGLAIQAVKEFAAGRTPSFVKTRYKDYTVNKPEVSASERVDRPTEQKARVSVPQDSFSDVAKKVAVLASDDNQRARGISYISGLEGGKVVISRQSKSGGPEVLQMLELKAGRVAVSIDGKYVGVATPDKAFEAAVGFMNGKSLVRRAPEKAAV